MTTTIELTAKKYKKLMLIGGGLCLASPICAIISSATGWLIFLIISIALLIIGGSIFVFAKLLAWWHHS